MDNATLYQKYTESAAYIKQKIGGLSPKLGIMLGSGLGALSDSMTDKVEINYADIPNYPVSTVKGHAGQIAAGRLEGTDTLIFRGRFHNYEGWEPWQMTYNVRVMRLLGVEKMIIVNAAGGVNRGFKQGDIMLLTDHISLFAPSPLRGQNMDEFGPRFPDMSEAYSRDAIKLAMESGAAEGFEFKQGVYAFCQGPMYETPAEIRLLALVGADAVGMSTVAEVITAVHAGIKVLGISTITNMAAGLQHAKLSHLEVLETEKAVEDKLCRAIRRIAAAWRT